MAIKINDKKKMQIVYYLLAFLIGFWLAALLIGGIS